MVLMDRMGQDEMHYACRLVRLVCRNNCRPPLLCSFSAVHTICVWSYQHEVSSANVILSALALHFDVNGRTYDVLQTDFLGFPLAICRP